MKYILILTLVFLSACNFVVQDTRTPTPGPIITAEAQDLVPTVTLEPEVIPEEEVGVVEPEPLPESPCLLIKGNISSSGELIYHVEGGASYNQVKIDEAKGEAFFCGTEEAEAAGFRKASR